GGERDRGCHERRADRAEREGGRLDVDAGGARGGRQDHGVGRIGMTWPTETGRFALGDIQTLGGETLPGAFLSWKTHGRLNAARDNAVLYPTSYSAQHPDLEWLIGPDGVLDPTRWFIVIPDMFGNALSSSPSNTPGYPKLVTAWDNVQAQRRL